MRKIIKKVARFLCYSFAVYIVVTGRGMPARKPGNLQLGNTRAAVEERSL